MTPPYTHEENSEPLRRGISLVSEDIRKPEQTSSITSRALREHDDRTTYSFPHLFQTFGFLLVVGCLERDPPGVGDHRPKRDYFESEDFCMRSRLSVFGGECGGV